MLTHKNFSSGIGALMNSDCKIYSTDRHLSYLPLAHIFEKLVLLSAFSAGA